MYEKKENENMDPEIKVEEQVHVVGINEMVVNMSDEFFIALCETNSKHSYITLGVKTDDGTVKLLATIGKGVHRLTDSLCPPIVDVIFSTSQAHFSNHGSIHYQNEHGKIYGKREQNLNYKAYALSYQQYLNFLHYLKALSLKQDETLNLNSIRDNLDMARQKLGKLEAKDPINSSDSAKIKKLNKRIEYNKNFLEKLSLKAYCPVAVDGDNVYLKWQDLSSDESAVQYNIKEKNSISIDNTCRHSAVRLSKKATSMKNLGQGISSFFKRPPLKTVFKYGEAVQNYFYILPLPPTSFKKMERRKKHILITIYQRLDKIIMDKQNDIRTIEKFEHLKDLYQRLATNSSENILEVIEGIRSWENERMEGHLTNIEIMKSHRKTHWFHFATATEKMFNLLHKEFEKIENEENYKVYQI